MNDEDKNLITGVLISVSGIFLLIFSGSSGVIVVFGAALIIIGGLYYVVWRR